MKHRYLTFYLVITAFFGSVGQGFALPACSETKPELWHFCIGTVVDNGDKFYGTFINNKKNGVGEYTWKNGDTFAGIYKNDKKNGAGKYSYANGETFEGNFWNGMAHGEGVYTYLDGSKFLGKYQEGKRSGSGKMIFADGAFFEGYYLNGARTGFGLARFSNGDKYSGHWSDNKRVGQGIYTWENGDIYAGYWEEGKKSGHGNFSYINGSYFFGNFENGLANGWGFSVTKDNYVTLCEYAFGDTKQCTNPETGEEFSVLENRFESHSEIDRKNIQEKLTDIGFYQEDIDGLWGRDSFAAILKYASLEFESIALHEPLFANQILSSLLGLNLRNKN